jgi:hypothetical protein
MLVHTRLQDKVLRSDHVADNKDQLQEAVGVHKRFGRVDEVDGAKELAHLNDRWERVSSPYAEYSGKDIFDQELVRDVIAASEQSKIEILVKGGGRIILWFLLITLILASFFDDAVREAIARGNLVDRIASGVAAGLRAPLDWLEQRTGNAFLGPVIVFAGITIADRFKVHGELHRIISNTRKVTEETFVKKLLRRQMYIGSGQIRFGAGTTGILIAGKFIDLGVHWSVVDCIELIFHNDDDPINFSTHEGIEKVLTTERINNASHLLINIKPSHDWESFWERWQKDSEFRKNPAPLSEFVVVPKHFFRKPQSGHDWETFVQNIFECWGLSRSNNKRAG